MKNSFPDYGNCLDFCDNMIIIFLWLTGLQKTKGLDHTPSSEKTLILQEKDVHEMKTRNMLLE